MSRQAPHGAYQLPEAPPPPELPPPDEEPDPESDEEEDELRGSAFVPPSLWLTRAGSNQTPNILRFSRDRPRIRSSRCLARHRR